MIGEDSGRIRTWIGNVLAISPPPISSEIKYVTFDQPLNVIAKAWDGILIYGVCAEPDHYAKFSDIEAANRIFF